MLQSGEIERLSGAFLRLPERATVFAGRAARLRQLAPGHPMQEYLHFIARLADAQQWMLQNLPPVPLPGRQQLAQCKAHGMPPLNIQTHRRDRAWCEVLRSMLRALAEQTADPARNIIIRLEGRRDELYEAQASKLLSSVYLGLDPATAPLIAAALQVYWVQLVLALGPECFDRIEPQSVCPACGSRPVCSVVRIGQEAGRRYLRCSLCSTEWHMVRIKCTSCESTRDIRYHGIEGGSKAVLAESCEACGSYLKILHMEREPKLEPVADDLASTALDLLMADTGKLRSGQNLMLIPGEQS